MTHLKPFLQNAVRSVVGSNHRGYHAWMGALTLVMMAGTCAYWVQLRDGLAATGMNDHVSWGLYISNFVFLVGLGDAAMMIILPAYILHDVDFRRAVLIGQGVAVCAVLMALAFVVVDLGSPWVSWHLIPGLGYLNWPGSMLAWDVVVLNSYLLLNLGIPLYLLYNGFAGRPAADKGKFVPWIYLSVFLAVVVHLVTAFLFSGLPARPWWHSALLGPRFLASAFAAGSAFMILYLYFIHSTTAYAISEATFAKLAMIVTVAAQINLVMLGSEVFTQFYPSMRDPSAVYLFFGYRGRHQLVPWIWTAMLMNVGATVVLTIHRLRRNPHWLIPACAVLFGAIWTEKGMGMVVPGFVPSPLGEVVEYFPTWVEWTVTAGIWALGFFVLTVLVRVALPIEMGKARSPAAAGAELAAL